MLHWPIATEEWVGIVDDDESIRRSLARLLQAQGIRTETFASADEFLEHQWASPSCLVIDVQLGTSTGFDLRDRLVAMGLELPPIIFITARDDLSSAELAHAEVASGLLRKPLRADALLALLRPHLRQQHVHYRSV